MTKKVHRGLLVDFEDSFTYNLLQELTELGLEMDLISWRDLKGIGPYDLLVLGPGPGHPDDYRSLYPLIRQWLGAQQKIFAVCLGHQILWRIFGKEVSRSLYPLHGQQVELPLKKQWRQWLGCDSTKAWVQRYNSLAVINTKAPEGGGHGIQGPRGVKNLVLNNEVMISRSSLFISYQFHPESMGTKCRSLFFRPILRDLL